jgi:hypothetical protein
LKQTFVESILGRNFENVKNLAVVFGTRRGLDPIGRVNLHFQDSPSQWIETLLHVNPTTLHNIRTIQKRREEKEISLAKKLGLAYFYADYTLSSTEEYFAFLSNVEREWEKTKGKWKFTEIAELNSLKIRIVDVDDYSVKHFSSDYSLCTLIVPLTCAPPKLFDFIDEKGVETVAKHHEFIKESEQLNFLLNKVKRVFRLRALTYDNDIVAPHLISCCLRLLQHFHQLQLCLDGLRLHIGNEYSIKDEDGTVFIRWDFKM